MSNKTFNNVKLNLTLKTQSTRANLLSTSEDLAVQMGKIQKWYTDFAWSAWTAPTVTVTGSGNAVTSASYGTGANANKLTLTKGTTFLTEHPTVPTDTDTTSTASPAFGGTFTAVDSVTRDSNGHVLKINTKTVTVPNATTQTIGSASKGTDLTATKVTLGTPFSVKAVVTFTKNTLPSLTYDFRMSLVIQMCQSQM